jgi:PhzF family phenazine biosynthesis protein
MRDTLATLQLLMVDVFADQPMGGNPAAIFTGGLGLEDTDMQRIARFMNLSETVFLLPPRDTAADYLARTFTVRREIPFAGHATLAAAHAHAAANGAQSRLLQECRAGLIPVECETTGDTPKYVIDLPPPHAEPTGTTVSAVAEALGLPPSAFASTAFPVAATGVRWLLAELNEPADLSRIDIDHARAATVSRSTGSVGITVFARGRADGGAIRLRAFAPAEGIFEDPVCGSCAGAIAAHLGLGQTGDQVIRLIQGEHIGRAGEITIDARRGPQGVVLRLGGRCRSIITGQLRV